MLYTILIVIFVLWLLGSLASIGGSLINLLLILIALGLIFDFLFRDRTPK